MNAHYALAGLCVIGGVVTHIMAPEGPIALTLVIAGTGALAKKAHDNAVEARRQGEEAARERKRADHWQEQTQTLMRK